MATKRTTNGYLRQGEFRRWALSVDDALGQLNAKVTTHSELLAVLRDRSRIDEGSRTDVRKLIYTVIAGMIVTVASVVLHLVIHAQ